MSAEAYREPGSFRDPGSGVIRSGHRVFRYFDRASAERFEALVASGLLRTLEARGAVTAWERVPSEKAPDVVALAPSAALVVEQPPIPFVSYPYEWPFDLLKSAALLTLEIQALALDHGLTLKDATPYNVQFVGTRPVFIDLGSFEPCGAGGPWAAYTQFCRLFLYPLLLSALTGVPYHGLLRASLEGIDTAEMNRLLPMRHKLRGGVFRNVVLHSWLERWSHGMRGPSELASPPVVGTRVRRRLVDRLSADIDGLPTPSSRSRWMDYDGGDSYSAEARERKEELIDSCLATARPAMVWDLGCNTGRYSRLAARRADHVVAMDADASAVNALVAAARREHPGLLPLVMDVLNPSPSQGWAQAERTGLAERGRPDLILCLGLLHHLVIAGHVPVRAVVAWLAGLTPRLVVEFVPDTDPGFQRLLRWRASAHHRYTRQELETALREQFRAVLPAPLPDSDRVLYTASSA